MSDRDLRVTIFWLTLLALVFLAFRGPTVHAQEEEVADVPTTAWVRLTYYVEAGVTFSGGRTGYGQTACSWNYAIGQRFRFDNGEEFVCTDRGHLGSSGWLDLWRRPDLIRAYGTHALVELL